MYDIAGPNCPLYGIKNGVSRKNAPKFKMSHMFAVIALNIVNEGHGGNIAVKSAGIAAAEEIVGDFDVNILGNPSKNIYDPVFTKKTNSKKSTKVELSNAVVIESGKSATLYLAVKPFDASGKELTISINGDAKKGNGASKTIKMPAGSKFEAGKVTTITVPVEKLSFGSTVTNVNKIQGTYKKSSTKLATTTAVNYSGHSTQNIIVNGENISAYVLGSENGVGSITIKGTAKELLPYVPIEFYASSWDGKKSVMRVENIKVHYGIWLVLGTYYYTLEMGFSDLTNYMAAERIQFSGLVPLEQHSVNNSTYLTILDEEPYHKKVSVEQIEKLLQNFDDDNDGKAPTFAGLKAAIENPSSLPNSKNVDITSLTKEADITAAIIYKKLSQVFEGKGTLGDLASLIFSSPKAMFETLSDTPIEATLSTVSKGGKEGATDNRILVWGLSSPNVK